MPLRSVQALTRGPGATLRSTGRERDQCESLVRRPSVGEMRVEDHDDRDDDDRDEGRYACRPDGVSAGPADSPATHRDRVDEVAETPEQRDATAPQQPGVAALDPHPPRRLTPHRPPRAPPGP